VPYQHDGEEARALILWIAKQPWSDGRVAMVGEGYSGFTAWAAAARPPAALKAIATSAPLAPGIDMPMVGGIFENSAYRWSLQVTNTTLRSMRVSRMTAVARAQREVVPQRAPLSGPGADLRQAQSDLHPLAEPPELRQVLADDGAVPRAIRAPRHPDSHDVGLFRRREPAALYYFSQHLRYNPHADHTLLIGPYDDSVIQHGSLTSPVLRDYAIDPARASICASFDISGSITP
jgi:pimeloyl-ACP methyl ester carboxylesterase